MRVCSTGRKCSNCNAFKCMKNTNKFECVFGLSKRQEEVNTVRLYSKIPMVVLVVALVSILLGGAFGKSNNSLTNDSIIGHLPSDSLTSEEGKGIASSEETNDDETNDDEMLPGETETEREPGEVDNEIVLGTQSTNARFKYIINLSDWSYELACDKEYLAELKEANHDLIIPSVIHINGQDVAIKKVSSSSCMSTTLTTRLIISEGIEEIDSFAFSYNDFSEIILPSSLKTIGMRAFNESRLVKELFIPSTVTTIKSSAFANMCSLSTLEFEDATNTSIETRQFTVSTTMCKGYALINREYTTKVVNSLNSMKNSNFFSINYVTFA